MNRATNHEPTPPGGLEPPDPLRPPPFGDAPRAQTVLVLFFMMMVGLVLVGGLAQFLFGFGINALVTEVIVVFLPVFVVLRRVGPWRALKLDRPPDRRDLLLALAGVLGLAVLLSQFTYWTDQWFPMPEFFKEAYLQAITAESPSELVLLLVVAAAIPGFCEEIAFRGYFQQVFAARFGAGRGVLVAALLFAIMHLDPWHLPALFIIGAYLGLLMVWTDSLWIPVLAHATNNAASVLLVYLSPDASLSQMAEPPAPWLLLTGGVVFVLAVQQLRAQHRRVQGSSWPGPDPASRPTDLR